MEMMMEDFTLINEFNEEKRINVGIGMNLFPLLKTNPDGSEVYDSLRGKIKGVKWKYNKNEVLILSDNVINKAYPSSDGRYAIVLYSTAYGDYKAPYNAIVYREDGAIHKILTPPAFQSELLLKMIETDQVDNPPLNLKYEGALWFNRVFWAKDDRQNVVTAIEIGYDREWVEKRILFPETGEFGEVLGSGRL
jgi:hypothetical protein